MNTAPADIAIRPSGIHDAFGPLLRLDRRDRAGLLWVKHRSRMWLNGLKRRRKYLPRGCSYTPEESDLIGHLAALETATGRLLELSGEGVYPPA